MWSYGNAGAYGNKNERRMQKGPLYMAKIAIEAETERKIVNTAVYLIV